MRRATQLRMALEKEILTGVLAPSTRLDEARLAARFDVSRTPVREALVELAAIGLVEMRPHHGATVATISLKRLFEMFETMAELEAACARFAARRITAGEIAELRVVHDDCRRLAASGDYDAYYDRNAEFHETIYRATHNAFLAEQVAGIRNRLEPYRRIQLRRAGRLLESFDEHERVVTALLAHDSEAAWREMHDHVAIQGESFNDFISSLPQNLLAASA
jgi:DNA-binding GntR family transcriptional regulator